MDPQQRLLLERGYEALHAAELGGLSSWAARRACSSASPGIEFARGAQGERGRPQRVRRDRLAVTPSRLAGCRSSWGCRGRASRIDTACSSTLVAGHAAWRAVQLTRVRRALLESVETCSHPASALR